MCSEKYALGEIIIWGARSKVVLYVVEARKASKVGLILQLNSAPTWCIEMKHTDLITVSHWQIVVVVTPVTERYRDSWTSCMRWPVKLQRRPLSCLDTVLTEARSRKSLVKYLFVTQSPTWKGTLSFYEAIEDIWSCRMERGAKSPWKQTSIIWRKKKTKWKRNYY